MICPTCTAAADQRADRTAHCNNAGCTCGHRTERYGTTTTGATTSNPGRVTQQDDRGET